MVSVPPHHLRPPKLVYFPTPPQVFPTRPLPRLHGPMPLEWHKTSAIHPDSPNPEQHRAAEPHNIPFLLPIVGVVFCAAARQCGDENGFDGGLDLLSVFYAVLCVGDGEGIPFARLDVHGTLPSGYVIGVGEVHVANLAETEEVGGYLRDIGI